MGCVTSKIDQLPVVSLCRDRCNFLQEALLQSYALADAHVAYMQSLKTLGPCLHQFFDQCLKSTSGDDSTVSIEKPPKRRSPLSSPGHSFSTSNSDSHIQFDTDSEDEESGTKDFSKYMNEIHLDYLNQGILTSYPLPNYDYHAITNQNREVSGSGWKTPPPPAPRSAAWDYLNFFDENYERYELPYFSSKAVKNKGADDHLEAQVVNQILGVEKSSANYTKEKRENSSGEVVEVRNGDAENRKKVDSSEIDEVQKAAGINEPKNQSGNQSASEVIKELQVLFEKASKSGYEVLNMLDTGKFRYHHKKSFCQGSVKMFHMITSKSSETESLLSKEKISSMDNDEIVSSQNLSSTLRKLCMWEKKLYDEVKAEEKLRIIHTKKDSQTKSLDQKGADARRVDNTRTSIRALSTKMRVAVQVIDNIAITINKLVDEELWPQVKELIHRLFVMWKVMLECHSCQCQKVLEAHCLDVITLNENLNDAQLEVAIKLKLELQNWILSFSSWIEAQRGYVKALNGWLHGCLLYEPEEIAEGVSSFSGCGVHLVFVILNQWSKVMDRLSEKEVLEAVDAFLMSISQVLEQHNSTLQQRVIADKDTERKVNILEKEERKMQKIMQDRVKKMTLWAREESAILQPRDTSTTDGSSIRGAASLLYGLKQILLAMEKLATQFRQPYEELYQCIEKCKTTQDNT